MTLTHDFFLLNQRYRKDIHKLITSYQFDLITICEEQIKVNDDFIVYIEDTLKFFKTVWPTDEVMDGLAYCGYSIIDTEQIAIAKKVFEGWKSLFLVAPQEFIMNGCYIEEEGYQGYEQLNWKQTDVIHTLDLLIDLCEQALSSGYFILHCGI